MKKDPYTHPRWQKKRLRILSRDGWSCVACGDDESTLHVHHAEYRGDPWSVEDSMLQTLCERCHGALGSHPKGGLHVEREMHVDEDGTLVCIGSTVVVRWCPQCGKKKFNDKGSFFRCINCGWSSGHLMELGGVTTLEDLWEWT